MLARQRLFFVSGHVRYRANSYPIHKYGAADRRLDLCKPHQDKSGASENSLSYAIHQILRCTSEGLRLHQIRNI